MKKYGLLGYPLTHSFSKKYFTEKFEKENINSSYENFEIDCIEKFDDVVKNHTEVVGFNVTIPYKEQIIPFLDELNDSAKEIGAVNTIRVLRTESGFHLKGFNTDTFGFESSLKPLLKEHHKKALILGAGGAAKAIKYVFNQLGIEFLTVTRQIPKAKEVNYSDLGEDLIREFTIIVNCTPLGTYPNVETFPDIPYQFIGEKHLLYDLVYNPEETKFMQKGKANGSSVKNGYEMLIQQAEKAYEIWNTKA